MGDGLDLTAERVQRMQSPDPRRRQALYRPKDGVLTQLDAPNPGLGAQTEVAAGAGPARERGRRSFAAGCMRRRRAPLQTRPTDGPRHRRLGTHRKSPVPTSMPWRVQARDYGIISAKAKHATIVTLVRRRPETFEIAGCRPEVHQSIEAPGSPWKNPPVEGVPMATWGRLVHLTPRASMRIARRSDREAGLLAPYLRPVWPI